MSEHVRLETSESERRGRAGDRWRASSRPVGGDQWESWEPEDWQEPYAVIDGATAAEQLEAWITHAAERGQLPAEPQDWAVEIVDPDGRVVSVAVAVVGERKDWQWRTATA